MEFYNFIKKATLTITCLLLFVSGVMAQPALIPDNPGSNVYAITFTDENQRVIAIEFDATITNLGNTSGWTITVGGVPATILGPIIEPTNDHIILFQLSASIGYADRNNVFVTYDQAASTASPKLGGAGGDVASFGPQQAVNNLPLECEMWDPSLYSYNLTKTEICAPAEVEFDATFYIKTHYVNSINYDPSKPFIRVGWGDATAESRFNSEISPGVFSSVFSHVYPDDPSVCYWDSYIRVGIAGIGFCDGGGLRKTNIFQNHSTDDEGDGVFTMQIDTIPVCLGQDFTEIFTDATYFNCNPQTEPDFSNDGRRHLRFTYGTSNSAEPRIQDILVNGIPMVGAITGPVLSYDSIRTSGIPAPFGWEDSDPISHVANLGTDAVGQVFEIQLENWGPCNPYDGGFGTPIITYSYIKIVDGPIADAGPDQSICEGDDANMAGAILRTATTGFWDTSTGDGSWTNANSPGGAVYTPGSNDISSGGVWLVLHASDPVSGCPEHVDSMYLTIDPIPGQPTLTRTGPASFCFGTNTVELESTVSPNGSYAWYKDGVLQGAFTTRNITLDQVSHSGDWTVVVFGNTANACPSPPSNARSIEIYPLATATDPPDQALCEVSNNQPGDASFSVTLGGGAASVRWQRSSNGGTSWVDITGANSPNDGADYADFTTTNLKVNDVVYAMNGYQYRVEMTTTNGSCVTYSNAGTLTVYPTPEITTQPSNTTICELGNTSFNVVASLAAGSIASYQWQHENTNLSGGYNPEGVYSDWDTPTLLVNGPSYALNDDRHRVYITSDQGCVVRSNNRRLYINPLADITTQPQDESICVNENASFTVVTDGNPTIDNYQWEVSTNGGSTWNNVSGAEYGGETSATLSISNVGSGKDGYQYRVILTTPGGCDLPSDPALLTVNPAPLEKNIVSADNNICFNTSTDVIIENSEPGITYEVFDANGDVSIGTVAGDGSDVSVATPGLTNSSYTYYVVASSPFSCARRNGDEVTIDVNPQFILAALAEDASICLNDSYNFRVNMTGGTGPYDVVYKPVLGSNVTLNNYDSGDPISTGPLAVTTDYTLVSVVDDRGCPADAFGPDITITVGLSYDEAIITAGADICEGDLAEIRLQSVGGAPPYTYTITGDYAPGPFDVYSNDTTIMVAGLAVGTRSFTINNAVDNCSNTAGTGIGTSSSLDVFELPDISGTTNNAASICNDGTTDIDLASTVSATVYSWTIIAGAGAAWDAGKAPVAGSITEGVGSQKIAQQLKHSETEPVTVTYRITSAGPGATACPGNSEDHTVVVAPTPVVTSPPTVNVCNNTAFSYTITSSTTDAGLSFEWSRGAVVGISNPAVSGQSSNPITETLVNTTVNPVDVDYTITPKIMGCDGVPFTLTVTVNPTAVITSPNTAMVCDSVDLNYNITTSTTVGTISFDWSRALVANISNGAATGSGSSINEFLDNTSTETVDVDYIITPSVNGCPGTPFTLTVTVNPTPVITSVNFLNICDNTPLGYTITSSTTDPGLVFNWSRAFVAGISNAANSGSGTSINESLDNTSAEPINVDYVITPSLNGCDGTPFTLTVRVNPTTTINSAATDRVCNNTALGYTITSPTTDPALIFNWSRPLVAGISNGAVSSTGSSINESLDNTTPEPIDVDYTITPEINGCPGTPFTLTITVLPSPVITSPATLMICDNDKTDYSVTSSTTAPGRSFRWSRAAVAGIANPANSGTGGYINEFLDNTSTEPVDVVYEIIASIFGCDGPTFTLTVSVNPTPVITSANTVNICNSTALGYTITSSTTDPALSFEWDRAAVAGISNAAVSGGTANPINETLVNTSTEPVDVLYVITPKINGCDGIPYNVTVTVNPTAVITSPAADTICDNTSLGYNVTSSTSDPGLQIDWTRASVPGITPATGAGTGFLINETLDNSTTEPISVDYIITPSINGCPGTPHTLTVVVNPTPVITSPLTRTICDDTPLGYTIGSSTGDAALEFSWNRNPVGGISNAAGSGTTALINEVLDNTTNNDIDVVYNMQLSIYGCTGPMSNLTVTVEPTPMATITNTTAAICTGDNVNMSIGSVTVPSNPADLSFDVSVTPAADPDLGGTAYTNLSDVSSGHAINGTLTNSSSAPITVTFTITPKLAGCASGTPVQTTVVVNPKPDVSLTNHIPVFPTGGTTAIELDGSVAGSTFGWNAIFSNTTGASDGGGLGIGDSIKQQIFNATAAPEFVTYRVAPTANGCPGDTAEVTVQVDPNVDMTVVNDPAFICSGASSHLELSSSVTGVTFAWTVTDADGAGASAGSGGPNTALIEEVLVNTTTAPITVTYSITPTGPAPTFIPGTTEDHVVTIYPIPQGFYDNREPEICDGSSTNIGLDSDVAGSTFTWTVSDPTGGASGAAASVTPFDIGDSITQTLVNAGNTPFTVTYHIRPTGQGVVDCPGAITDIDVVVHPTPVASITNAAPVICSETDTDITLGASVVGSTFTWTVVDPKGTGATDGIGVIGDKIVQTLVNATQTPVTITYSITPFGPGATACPGSTVTQDVTVNPLPITSPITGIDTVCEQTSNLVFSVVHTASSFYEWNVPASIGSPTFGGTGMDSYAVIILAADVAAVTTDSIWVFETNQYSCTRDTIYHPLTVIPVPDPQPIAGDASVCALTTHTYSVPDNPGSTYQWFVPPGASFASADPTIHTVDVSFGLISGQIRVRETTAGGCITDHDPLNITVNQLPISILSADRIAACDGDTITFTAGPAAQLNYEFFVNGAPAQNGASEVFQTASLSNSDQVTVNVTSPDGCEQLSAPVVVTIYDNPVVTLASSDADNIICFGENVDFTATSASAVNYNFFLNGVSEQSGPLNFWSTINLINGDEVHVEVLSAFGCPGSSDTITTLVNDLPVGELSGDATICPGNSTDLSVNITVGNAPYEVTLDNGVPMVSGYNSGDPIAVSPPFTTTYNLVSISDANGCLSAVLTPSAANLSGSATVTVRDTVEILTQPKNALVCEGVDTSFTVGAFGDGIQYQWESTQDLGAGFTAIGGATAATYTVSAPGAAEDSIYYRVRVFSSFCPEEAYSDTVQLVLKYDPNLLGHPADQLICENDPTGFSVDAGLTADPIFNWEVSYNSGSSWLSLGDSSVYNGTTTDSITIISAASRFHGYQYRAIVTGECGSAITSNVATLSIDERPEILEHPSDTVVCEGSPLSFSVDAGVTTSPAFQWQVDMGSGWQNIGDTAGVYTGTSAGVLQVLNPQSRFDGYNYRVEVSGSCPVAVISNPALLQISERPEIISQPTDTVICENESPVFAVNAGVTTGASYVWEVSYDGGTAWLPLGDTAIYTGSATNILRLTGVPSSYDGLLYHVVVSGSCTPAVTSNDVSLTVKERPEILSHPGDSIVCEGSPAAFTVDAGVTTNALYQWQVNMNDGNGFNNLGDTAGVYSGFDQASLDVLNPLSRFNGYQYRVIVSGDCTPPQVSNTATLTVLELPEIITQPTAVTICEEQNTFFSVNSGVTTAPVYNWQVDMGSGFEDIGQDTGIYSGTGTSMLFLTLVPSSYDSYSYRVVISGSCAPDITSDEVLLTVHENPEIILQPVNDTVCEGDPASFTVDGGVTTGVVYQWQVNRTGIWEDLSDGVDYSGANGAVLTVNNPASIYNGYRYRARVSGSCVPPVISEQALLVIHERPEILTQPQDDEVCEDGDTYFTIHTGNTTGAGILWEYSTDGVSWSGAGGLPEAGDPANDTLFMSAVPSTYDGMMFHAVVSGTCTPAVTSDSAVMTVFEKPQIDIQPVDVLACEQDTVIFFTDAGVSTNPIYQWEIWNGAAWIVPPVDIFEGSSSDTLSINGIHSGINGLEIRVRISGTCAPEVISDTAVLTVDERPEIISMPADMEICEMDSAYFGINAGVTTSPVYTWEYFDGSNWLTATGGFFENENTDTLRLYGGGVPSTWNGTLFRAIVSNGCGPNDTSEVAMLTVNERPEIIIQPVDAITCEGIATSYSVDAGVTTAASYLWMVHNGLFWAPATGIQYSGQGSSTLVVVSPNSSMNGYAYRVLVQGACTPPITSDSVSLTVLENPEILVQPVSATVCEGQDTSFVVDPGVTTNPVFTWYYNDNVNGWQTVTADGIHSGENTAVLSITAPVFGMDNWLYQVEVGGDCGVPISSQTAALVVHRRPEILAQPEDTTTCELRNVSFSVDIGDTDSPLLQWEEFDGSTWTALSDGGSYVGVTSSELKVFAVDSSMTGFRYRVRVTGICDPEVVSDEAELIVHSAPVIWTMPVDSTICEGDDALFSIFATGTAITYQWQVDDGSGFSDITDSNGGVYNGYAGPDLQLSGADRSYDFNRYRVQVEGACIPLQISDLAILFVQTPAEIQDQPDDFTLCEFENATFTADVSGEGLVYQWEESRDGGSSWSALSDAGVYIGSETKTLTIFSVGRDMDGYQYRLQASGICGAPVTSDEVLLTVNTSPEILTQPVTFTACEDEQAPFVVEAQGTSLVYQWQVNDGSGFSDILTTDVLYTGADTDSLSILNAQLPMAGWSYRVIVTGTCTPPAVSDPVLLLVNPNPPINLEPEDAAICEWGTATFTADVSGPDLIFQWMVDKGDGNGFVNVNDDSIHIGANTELLSLTNTPVSMDGWRYRLNVYSACKPNQTREALLTVWPNPVPDITPLTVHPDYPLICGGDLLTLDGNPSSGSGGYAMHQWSGSVGPLSAVDQQVVDFQTVVKGEYNLVYTVTDDRGCKGTELLTVINDRPTAQFVSNALPSCGYIEVDFTNTSSADANSFLWDFDDGSTSTEEDVTHGFDNLDPSGLVAYYNISLVATSINGCNDTARSVVTIYPKIVAEITADTVSGCHPLNVTFTSQPGGAGYSWDFGDGSPVEDGSYIAYHLFENYGTEDEVYTVTLTTTSHYGCTDSESLDITVAAIPQPNFTAVPLVQTYPDATVSFTNTTMDGPWTFLWEFGDSITSTEENPVHTYAEPGEYQVSFHVINGLCEEVTKTTVIIHPTPPIAAFAEPQSACHPVEIQFVNQSQWSDTYLWDFGDGYVSRDENPTHTFYDVGEFTVRLQATGPGGTDLASWTFEVWETPYVAFNSAPDSVFVKDKPVRFFNQSAGATEYAWDFGDYYEDGTAAPGNFSNAVDTSHIYFTEGYKNVTLVAWNDHCIDSLTLEAVKVIPKGELEFPTVFRPDPNGPNGGYVDPNDPNLDPNYANSIFFPGVNKQVDEYHLYVYNRWGEQIFRSDDINLGWDGYVKGRLAAQGVYFWKVTVVYKNGAPDTKTGDITLLHKKQQ